MNDERERLDRVVRGFAPPNDAFERLVNRRSRKQRNQRLVAGAIGVVVALATAAVLVRAIESDRVPARPPIPPRAAAGTLAYALDGDIYVADPDGSNVVKIADGISEADCVGFGGGGEYWVETDDMWSPDGKYIAYRYSDCSGGPDVWPEGVVISDAKGNVLAKFATGKGWQIRWSPDSAHVAVWDDFGKTIGIYGPDGVRQTQLTVPRGGADGDTDPYWMPDGSAVVVFGSASETELPLDGGAPRPAPPSFLKELGDPRIYSPDGSRVAYVDHRSLTVARPDGSGAREVVGDWVGGPSWSPTGDLIAIAADGGGRSPIELRVLDVATGSVTRVTEGEPGSELEVVGFTPRGDRILFSTTAADDSWSLWSVGVDGSDARLIVDGTDGNFYRVPWSPETGGR